MNTSRTTIIKRSQRDYTMGFINQREKGEMTNKQAQDHYGISSLLDNCVGKIAFN